MKVSIHNVEEWVDLFRELEDIKNKYGSMIINETINTLKYLQEEKIILFKSCSLVIDALARHGINNISDSLNFLNSIKSIYSYRYLINTLPKLNVDNLAFINREQITASTYFNLGGYKKLIRSFDNDYVKLDFKTNGLIKQKINCDREFIEEVSDYKTVRRTIYTNDFRLRVNNLDKEILINIEEERDKLFKIIIDSLDNYSVQIILDSPNRVLEQDGDVMGNYKTLTSDGIIKDEYNQTLIPQETPYLTKKIIVNNAKFLVIAYINMTKIENIQLIISEDYYNHVQDLGVFKSNGRSQKYLNSYIYF